MGHYEIVLELRQVLRRNGYVAQRAEPCRNTIYRPSDVFHLCVKVSAAFGHSFLRIFPYGYLFTPGDYFPDPANCKFLC